MSMQQAAAAARRRRSSSPPHLDFGICRIKLRRQHFGGILLWQVASRCVFIYLRHPKQATHAQR